MKKIIRNNRIIALTFLTLFTGITAPLLRANDSNRVNPVIPVEMKFIGKINDQPLLQLNFAGNADQNDFTITIRDEFNEVLYREKVGGERFSKKFLLNTDELGDATLFFEISCRTTKRTVIYQVDRNTKLVENVSISEMR